MPKRPPRPPAYPTLPLSGHHVRLLRVQSGERDDTIKCETKIVDLRDKPNYYGLSYMCGSMNDTQLIELNGNKVRIRTNLRDFIVELRARHMTKSVSASTQEPATASLPWMWCDMICIDQEHLVERSRQVQMMDQIYANAQEVWAWVGYLIGRPDASINTLSVFDPSKESHRRLMPVSPSLAPYWNRCWIVQEIVSARHILVHVNTETWHMTDIPFEPGPGAFQKVLRTRQRYKVEESSMNLISLLARFQNSECSDPRDKIFALVKISEEHRQGRNLVISYSKTVTQVFFETLVFVEPTAERMLPQARFLAKALKLDFDTLWRFTTLQSNYLKSDIADDVTFWVKLPIIGEMPFQLVVQLGQNVAAPTYAPIGALREQECRDEALLWLAENEHDAAPYYAGRALDSNIVIIVVCRSGAQLADMYKFALVCTSEDLGRLPGLGQQSDFAERHWRNNFEVRLTRRQLLLAMDIESYLRRAIRDHRA